MEYIVMLIVGAIIGFKISSALNIMTIRRILDDLNVSEQDLRRLAEKQGIELPPPDEPKLEEIEIRIEEHEGTLYAYRMDTDQFLGQGPDREGLIQRLTENLTNVRLIVAKEQGADHLLKS